MPFCFFFCFFTFWYRSFFFQSSILFCYKYSLPSFHQKALYFFLVVFLIRFYGTYHPPYFFFNNFTFNFKIILFVCFFWNFSDFFLSFFFRFLISNLFLDRPFPLSPSLSLSLFLSLSVLSLPPSLSLSITYNYHGQKTKC